MRFLRFAIILMLLLNLSCHTRYGYLSKVRVGKNEHVKRQHPDARRPEKTEDKSEEWSNVVADTGSGYTVIPSFHEKKTYERNIAKVKRYVWKRTPFKWNKPIQKMDDGNPPPVNFYAKWALGVGLIVISGFLIGFPLLFGPLSLMLGVKAHREIKRTRERGKGMAYFAILIGSVYVLALFLGFMFAGLTIYELLLVALGLGIIGLLNYGVYAIIKNAGNKRSKSVDPNAPSSEGSIPYPNSSFYTWAIVMAALTLSSVFLVFTIAFGPMTMMFSGRAIRRLDRHDSKRRTMAMICYAIGVIATIGLLVGLGLVTAFLLGGAYASEGAGILVFMLLLVLILAAILSLIGMIVLIADSVSARRRPVVSRPESDERANRRNNEPASMPLAEFNNAGSFSAICGMLALLSVIFPFFSLFIPMAIINGIVCLSENKRFHLAGSGLAITGIILGLLSLLFAYLSMANYLFYSGLILYYLLFGAGIAAIQLNFHHKALIKKELGK